MAKRRRKSVNKILRKKIRLYLFYGVCGLLAVIFLLFSMVYIGVFGHIPTRYELKNVQNYLASEIYSADNVLLGKYYVQNRSNVDYDDIPQYLIDALVATEDARFYAHNGIDNRSILRVFLKTLLLRQESSGGGSTITQQLAKNLYKRKRYSIITVPVNKFREMIIAVRLEKVYDKKDILELYLNTVSFGENTYGLETASKMYFNKPPRNLKIEEAALLVGVLKGTYVYNPNKQTDKALQRRNVVLKQMVRYGYLKKESADSLKQLPLKLKYVKQTHNEGLAPYFREYLRLELAEWSKDVYKSDGSAYNIYTDGLKIYTTINSDLQTYAEQAVKSHLSRLQREFNSQWKHSQPWGTNNDIIIRQIKMTKRYNSLKNRGMSFEEIMKVFNTPVKMEVFSWDGTSEISMTPLDSVKHYFKFLHSGFIAMESKTGYIRAWVGGINHKYFQYDHVKSRRQAGSTFKPVVYAAALEKGYKPCDYIPNDSVVFKEYNDWTPRNADRTYGGYYSMNGGLVHSVNTVSVNLLMNTGISNVIRLAKEMGIRGDLPEVPSLALGTGEMSLFELVSAYNVFNNGGRMVKPVYLRRIEDKDGKVLYEAPPQVSDKDIITPENAEIIVNMLRNVVNYGTASGIRTAYGLDNDIAGKTGTTQLNTDGWFIGFTPDLIAGAWVGGDNPVIRFRSMAYGQGAHTALPIWAGFMRRVYSNPLYRNSKNTSFDISGKVLDQFGCPDYRDKEYESIWEYMQEHEKGIIDLIRSIFRKKNKRENEDNED
jgi:penicillin-binding protein 1A